MGDVVARLRSAAEEPCGGCCYGETMLLAAAEIEQLRARLAELESEAQDAKYEQAERSYRLPDWDY